MDLETVNKLLQKVALVHHVEDINDKEALQAIAVALMHIAQGINEIQARQSGLKIRRPVSPKPRQPLKLRKR
jgi:hypothetical protein